MGVSKSGYYNWVLRKPSEQQKKKTQRIETIQELHDESKQNYGAPKITVLMNRNGDNISERTVSSYMKEMGIKAQWVTEFKHAQQSFNEELKNILKQQFTSDKPNAVWCTDITYIWTCDDG